MKGTEIISDTLPTEFTFRTENLSPCSFLSILDPVRSWSPSRQLCKDRPRCSWWGGPQVAPRPERCQAASCPVDGCDGPFHDAGPGNPSWVQRHASPGLSCRLLCGQHTLKHAKVVFELEGPGVSSLAVEQSQRRPQSWPLPTQIPHCLSTG